MTKPNDWAKTVRHVAWLAAAVAGLYILRAEAHLIMVVGSMVALLLIDVL